MTTSTPVVRNSDVHHHRRDQCRASLDQTFDSLIAQMGRLNETPDGTPLPMVLEPHPGGRWYRHLGGDNGHLWGFVQSIKRPTLLEIWGPLFMSTAATSNLLYRLSETPEGTLIKFTHTRGRAIPRRPSSAARIRMGRASRTRPQGGGSRRSVGGTPMKIIDGLLAELEQEAETTRRVLERIPQAHLTWKPHPKSMSLGQLALHVATVPGNVAEFAAVDTIPEPPSFVQPEAATTAELVPSLTESVAKARRALGGFDDARMGAMWRLQSGGRDLLAMPRVAFVRAIMLNHWYHHRGQLLVYLRLLNQSVPSVYGPTADENPFAA